MRRRTFNRLTHRYQERTGPETRQATTTAIISQEQAMADSGDSSLMNCEIKELGPLDAIIKMLECPVCQGIPMPPIWNCVQGHIVCDQCRAQLVSCGLCRQPFSEGRNYFMERIIFDCQLTCPYTEDGCTYVDKGDRIKLHAGSCKFGPQIKWVGCQNGNFPHNAVAGGKQNGVKLYVIRAPHQGSVTPGKLYEYSPPGTDPEVSCASLPWGGGERTKNAYEVLVADPKHVKWVPSSHGVPVKNAIRGGSSEVGEALFIGRFQYENQLVNGKIHPSHQCCYIGVEGIEKKSNTYEILVEIPMTEQKKVEERNKATGSGYSGGSSRESDVSQLYS